MGDPVSIGLAVAGMMSSTIGAIKKGQAATNAANFNAQVAASNAVASRQQAAESETRARRLGRKRLGAVRLRGLSLDVREDAAREEELAALSIRHSGEVQAAGFSQTAGLDRLRGRTARSTARLSAATSLLRGGTKVYDILEAE